MDDHNERSTFMWQLRPVPVYNLYSKLIYAKFLAYFTDFDMEKYGDKNALPVVAVEGQGIFRDDQGLNVEVSSSLGTCEPKSFKIRPGDLVAKGIYCHELCLTVSKPVNFSKHIEVDSCVIVGEGEPSENNFVWPTMGHDVSCINVTGNGIGYQQNNNYKVHGNESGTDAFLSKFCNDSIANTSGFGASALLAPASSTPVESSRSSLPTVCPGSPASQISDSSSSYHTPPESRDHSPPQGKFAHSIVSTLTPIPMEDLCSSGDSPEKGGGDSGNFSMMSSSFPSPSF